MPHVALHYNCITNYRSSLKKKKKKKKCINRLKKLINIKNGDMTRTNEYIMLHFFDCFFYDCLFVGWFVC